MFVQPGKLLNEVSPKKTAFKQHVVTPKVANALDRVGLSNRSASIVLEALAEENHIQSTGANSYVMSQSSIRRARIKNREKLAAEVFNILYF